MQFFKRKKKSMVELLKKNNDVLMTENSNLKKAIILFEKNVSSTELAIYYNVSNDNVQLITVHQKFDYLCRLIELDFYGYFLDKYHTTTTKFQELIIFPIYNEDNAFIEHFFIDDFPCRPNKGYGSIMMEQFLNYIKPFGAEYVSGLLSPVDTNDIEHKNRLFHFYRKFGFSIGKINDKGEYPIRLNLR